MRPGAIAWAWASTIAVDFLVFGGLFSGLLETEHPAVLGAEDLFRRIPAGYLSFLVEVVLLAWVFERRPPWSARRGAAVGTLVGAAFAVAVGAGVWSFSTVPLAVLAVWSLTLLAQLSLAGWVLGLASGERWRSLRWRVAGLLVAIVAAGIVAQNLV